MGGSRVARRPRWSPRSPTATATSGTSAPGGAPSWRWPRRCRGPGRRTAGWRPSARPPSSRPWPESALVPPLLEGWRPRWPRTTGSPLHARGGRAGRALRRRAGHRLRLDAPPAPSLGGALGAVVAQIGDGDVVALTADGGVAAPVPDDPELDGHYTTSLCQPSALGSFRVAVIDQATSPLLGARARDRRLRQRAGVPIPGRRRSGPTSFACCGDARAGLGGRAPPGVDRPVRVERGQRRRHHRGAGGAPAVNRLPAAGDMLTMSRAGRALTRRAPAPGGRPGRGARGRSSATASSP